MITKQDTDSKYPNATTRHLSQIGWTAHFQMQLEKVNNDESIPARVVGVRKNNFRISNGKREWLATLAGRLKHQPHGLYPVTGDWVLMTDTVISEVLTRKNALSRGAAGTHGKQNELPQKEQVIATNLDTVFVVCGLDRDFNLRRIERYLTLVYNCGLNPVIILTKADLHQNPEPFLNDVETVAFGVPVHLVSALDGKGVAHLEQYLSTGQTTTMVGSSGAGKSTLLRIMAGVDTDIVGEARPQPGIKIGYLEQEPRLDADKDVRGNVARGEFGAWEETGRFLNLALLVGAYRGLGYGAAASGLYIDPGADRRVAAAFNATHQARAARLPSIGLTGRVGGASDSLSTLLSAENVAWTAGTNDPIWAIRLINASGNSRFQPSCISWS